MAASQIVATDSRFIDLNQFAYRCGDGLSVMLIPADAPDVVPRIGLMAEIALLDAGMFLPGDLFGHHLEVHHVMAWRRLMALCAVRRGR